MTEDASYSAMDTRDRKRCACGSKLFITLNVVEVVPKYTLEHVVPLPSMHMQTKAGERLPMVECLLCRTRYNRLWHPVV